MSETNKNSGGGARRLWPLFVGLPLILAVAVAAVLLSGERYQPPGQEPQPAEEGRQVRSGGEQASRGGAELGHPSLGSESAPVVMIEYGDYQ
ncbi:MAG: DsbA family protein [Actinobacteria bacterium]|nr:DsbA family protein [Actinomycetota bacterium]